MKRIFGIILAVLGVAAFFVYLVLSGIAKGLTIGNAILSVIIATAIALAVIGWIYLTIWLLN